MVSRLLSRLSTLSGLWTLQTALCRLHSGVCSNLYAVSGLTAEDCELRSLPGSLRFRGAAVEAREREGAEREGKNRRLRVRKNRAARVSRAPGWRLAHRFPSYRACGLVSVTLARIYRPSAPACRAGPAPLAHRHMCSLRIATVRRRVPHWCCFDVGPWDPEGPSV